MSCYEFSDLLSNSEHLLLEDYTTEFIHGGQMFRVNNRLELPSNFLVPHEFASWVLVCFVNHAIIYWQWRMSWCIRWGFPWKVSTKSFSFGKQWRWSTFLVKLRTHNMKLYTWKGTLSCAKFSEDLRRRKLWNDCLFFTFSCGV